MVAGACGSDDGGSSTPHFIAALSAFPAELAPLVEQATIDEKMEIDGRIFRLGVLGGTRVVLAMTGIGLVNAETTTRILLGHFAVTGVVVSAVAGSFLRIGDVAVPERWTFLDGGEYVADGEWLERAEEIAANGNVMLEDCTVPPSSTTGELVCLAHRPGIFVGGLGLSSDPFGGAALDCQPDIAVYPDVFGCDIMAEADLDAGSRVVELHPRAASGETGATEPLAAEDMETTAIAREATARGLPFIAFRAVSDGEGDPLGLPGFPGQFFAYYRLAANNAAAATVAFLETLAEE
jgi:nucleoside phosphorylase